MSSLRLPPRALTPLVTLLAVIAALPYLGGGPVWDDRSLIVDGLSGLSPSDLPALWLHPVSAGGPASGYYRPLALCIMALLSHLGFPALHVLALLLHAGSTALLMRLLRDRSGVLLGAAVFAVHPLAGEVLGWASALPDVLAVHLGLWSVLLARRNLVGAFLAVLAALLCKETGLLVLPAFLLAGLAPRRAWIPWGLAVVGYGALRMGLSGTHAPWHLVGKLHLVPVALAWPLGSLLFPWPLTPVRDLWAAPVQILPLGLLFLVLGGILARRDRVAWAGLGLAAAAPVMALAPVLDGYLAGARYAYLSLAGLALLVSGVEIRRRLLAPLGVVVCLSLGLHGYQAIAWSDDLRLFGRATEVLPGSSYAWHLLGYVQLRDGQPDGAARSLEQALAQGHPLDSDRGMLVRALVLSGRPARALALVQEGPHEELTAEYLAWWARAAHEAGDDPQALRMIGFLRRPDGSWDGPPWVPELAAGIPPE